MSTRLTFFNTAITTTTFSIATFISLLEYQQGYNLIRAVFSGILPGNQHFSVRPGESPTLSTRIYTDIDSLKTVSRSIPALGTISLYIRSLLSDALQSKQDLSYVIDGSAVDVGDIPNTLFARFGDSSRYKRPFSHLIPYEILEKFVNCVLRPALRRVLPPPIFQNFGVSYKTESARQRKKNGQVFFQGTFMNSQYLQELVDTMRSIIAESLDVGLTPFTNFMFVTSGIGLKSHFILNEDAIDLSTILCDLNWSLIDLQTTVVDVGFEHHHLNSSPMIGLWRTTGTQNTDSPFVHEELIRLFWGSDASLLKNNFHPDPFSNFRSLLGFQYKTSPRSTPALPGLKKWSRITSFQDHITTTCSIITNESYGARLELRMDGSSLITHWGQIVDKAVDSERLVHWEPAENIAGLVCPYFRCPSSDLLFLVDFLDNSTDERLLLKRPFNLDYLATLFDSNTWVQISAGSRAGFIPQAQLSFQSSSPTTTLFESVSITNDLYNLCSNDEQATGLLRLVSSGVSLPVIKHLQICLQLVCGTQSLSKIGIEMVLTRIDNKLAF
ncbi:hypothetical protein INT45_012465 [Circinella minor]|uniref:Uncharacterized protein n=1 Tax=Circinella minor TaxID=1195481 RepID=A0A8H7S128_9FUNG|nr:hypothetical protein INT45_012465 [Circinella minor]